MATYRYNVIVEVDVKTTGVTAGRAQTATAFAGIEQDAARASNTVNNNLNSVNANLGASTNQLGIWGRAFRGAFIGAVAGIAFSAIVGGMSSIVGKGEELIVQSVQYAAAFQMRENSMILYTGSLNNASGELSRLDALALRTTGLRLEDAETGSLRLRALGLDAKEVDNILVGLAKQKLIFGGVNDQQVQRVLLHFDQLAGGASNTGQIIKNIIRDMPGLSRVMTDSFGSINKFKAALQQDPDAALLKFAKGMADAKAPAGGLTNAIEKLEDRFILAGRQFGTPFLEPLTKDVLDLTDFLDKNADSWALWGQSAADAVQGAISAFEALKSVLPTAISPAIGAAPSGTGTLVDPTGLVSHILYGGALNLATAGASGGYEAFGNLGAINRRNDYYTRKANQAPATLGTKASISFGTEADIAAEKQVDAERARQKADKDAEMQRQKDLASAKDYAQRDIALFQDSIAIKEKAFDSYHRYTAQQELTYQKGFYALKARDIDQQIDLQKKNFERERGLMEDDGVARGKLALEEDTALSKLDRQKAENSIEAAIFEREQLIKIAEERRQALIQQKALEITGIQQAASTQEFNLNRQIDLSQTGYESLIEATIVANGKVVASTRDSFALQLQDQKLTKEQRLNLERELQLQIQDLNEQTREKVIAIQDQQSKAIEARITANIDFVKSAMGTFESGLASIQQLFQATPFFGAILKETLTLAPAVGLKNTGLINDTAINVESGKVSIYQAQLLLLDKIHDVQTETIDSEIRGQEDILKLQQIDGRGSEILETNKKIRLLETQKAVLGLNQAIERSNLEMSESLEKINEWTQKILAGDRDRVIHSIQEVNIAKDYQTAAIAYQMQAVTLGDKALINQIRQTEMLKTMTELRNEDLQAVLAIDKAQLMVERQYTYSKTRADAQVANFFAQQKGLTEVIGDAKINLLTTAYSGLENVADRLTRKFGAFRDVIKDLLSNLFRLAFNKLFGNAISGGGLNFGGGSNQGGAFGGFRLPGFSFGGGSAGGFGGGIAGLGAGVTGAAAGGSVFDASGIFGGIPGASDATSSGLLGPGGALPGSIGGVIGSSGQATTGFLAGLAPMLPFLGAGIGAGLFKNSIASQIFGGLGGAAVGLGLFGALGGALPAALAALPLLPIGAALLVAAFFINRSAARRRDEKTRAAAMVTALDALDKLIADVNADRTDGASALDQADQIRKQYLDQMSQLKDKKTRNIALADVSRLDAKISMLKTAVAGQVSRKQREDLMVPTFADGGSVSSFMSPVGYQFGYGGPRSDNMTGYFPAAGAFAKYSPTEYILDAETTRNVGVGNLDAMRATKGMSYQQMRRDLPVARRASGGSVASMSPLAVSSGSPTGSSSPLTLELTVHVGVSEQEFVKIAEATIKDANGSRQQLQAILKTVKDDGQHPLVTEIGKQLQSNKN